MSLLVGLPESSGKRVRSYPQPESSSPRLPHSHTPGGWTIGQWRPLFWDVSHTSRNQSIIQSNKSYWCAPKTQGVIDILVFPQNARWYTLPLEHSNEQELLLPWTSFTTAMTCLTCLFGARMLWLIFAPFLLPNINKRHWFLCYFARFSELQE
jgi:hypothetical protein